MKSFFAKKWVRIVLIALGVILITLQFFPVEKTNPPVTVKVKWSSQEAEAIARRACYDCHSNETKWPWYSSIAPISMFVSHDVVDGRKHLNFSEDEIDEYEEMVEEIKSGRMPFPPYKLLHPEARLTDSEQKILIDGIMATFNGEGNTESEHEHHEGEEHTGKK